MSKETKSYLKENSSYILTYVIFFICLISLTIFAWMGKRQADAADYYVSCGRTGSVVGTSWNTTFDNFTSAAKSATAAGDRVFIGGWNTSTGEPWCSYSGSGKRLSGFINGTSSVSYIGSSPAGQAFSVIIDGGWTTQALLTFTSIMNHTFSYITILQNNASTTFSRAIWLARSNNITLNNISAYYGKVNFDFINTLTCNNCVFGGNNRSESGFDMDWTSTNATFNCSIFTDWNSIPLTTKRLYNSNITYNNVLVTGAAKEVEALDSNSIVTYNNSVVMGSPTKDLSKSVFNVGDGQLMAYNSAVYQHWVTNNVPIALVGAGTFQNINNTNSNIPNFNSHAKEGFIFWVGADADLDYWEDSASILEQYGQRLTPYVVLSWLTFTNSSHNPSNGHYGKSTLCSDVWTSVCGLDNRLKNLSARGHEIGLHGYSHADLTNLNAFKITHATNTLTISTVGRYLSLNGATTVNMPYTTYPTLKSICDYINGLGGYTCTPQSKTGGDTIWSTLNAASIQTKSSGLDAVSDQSLAGGYTAVLAPTLFYNDEISEAWNTLKGMANIPDNYKMVGYPYASGWSTLWSYLNTDGFKGAFLSANDWELSNLSVFTVGSIVAPPLVGSDVKAHISALCTNVAANGGIIGIGKHEWLTNWTSTQTHLVAAELQKCRNVRVLTFSEIMNIVRTTPWVTLNDGLNFGRTWNSLPDYTPRKCSPLRDWGTNVGLTTDFAGNPIMGLPDAGPLEYQYQGQKWGSNTGAWASQNKNTWATTNKAYNKWNDVNCIKNTRWGTP